MTNREADMEGNLKTKKYFLQSLMGSENIKMEEEE